MCAIRTRAPPRTSARAPIVATQTVAGLISAPSTISAPTRTPASLTRAPRTSVSPTITAIRPIPARHRTFASKARTFVPIRTPAKARTTQRTMAVIVISTTTATTTSAGTTSARQARSSTRARLPIPAPLRMSATPIRAPMPTGATAFIIRATTPIIATAITAPATMFAVVRTRA